MTEGTPREPRTRTYTSDRGTGVIHVDGMGVVRMSEEVLDALLTEAGYTEVTS